MRRSVPWLLGLAVTGFLGGAWIGLRPFVRRETVVIVSLLDRKYGSKEKTDAIVAGIRRALDECGGCAGRFWLALEDQDVGYAECGLWGTLQARTRAAAERPEVAAIIGTSDSRACMVLSELNQAGLLMVSPDDRASYLTKPGHFMEDTPECYRPAGRISYLRVIPADDVLERGRARWAAGAGFRRPFVVRDSGSEERIFFDVFSYEARRAGMTPAGSDGKDRHADWGSLARRIVEAGPDLLYLNASLSDGGRALVAETRRRGFRGTVLLAGRPPAGTWEEGTVVLSLPRGPEEYGYLAARAVIESLERAGSRDREAILAACASLPVFDDRGDTRSNELVVERMERGAFRRAGTFTVLRDPEREERPRVALSFRLSDADSFRHAGLGLQEHSVRGTFHIDLKRQFSSDGFLDWFEVANYRERGWELDPWVSDPARSAELLELWHEALREHEIRASGSLPQESEAADGGRPLAELLGLVERAWKDRRPLWIRFGRVTDEEDPGPGGIRRADLDGLCGRIRALGFKAVSLSELRAGCETAR
jgi:branched-chain amino acid transport system substrate-binding protein